MVFDIYLAFLNLLFWFSSPLSAFQSFKYIRQHWQFGIGIVVCSAFITHKSLVECNTPVNLLMCHFLFIGVIFMILWEIILQFTQSFKSGNQPLLSTKAVLKQMMGSIDWVSSPPIQVQGSLLSHQVQEEGENKYVQVQSSWHCWHVSAAKRETLCLLELDNTAFVLSVQSRFCGL